MDKKTAIKLTCYVLGTALIIFLCLFRYGLFEYSDRQELLRILSDGTGMTGGVFLGIGIISYSASKGAFDFFSRAKGKNSETKHVKKNWFVELSICGVICLIFSIIFMILM